MTVEIISSMGPTGIELATPGSAVRHASVARQVTDCNMRPCAIIESQFYIIDSLSLDVSLE